MSLYTIYSEYGSKIGDIEGKLLLYCDPSRSLLCDGKVFKKVLFLPENEESTQEYYVEFKWYEALGNNGSVNLNK